MTGHEHTGHRDRMRQRFAHNGLEGFAPHEVLELLLFYAIPRQNVNPLAHRLIHHFGSLDAVLCATPQQLCQVQGVGEQTAILLSLVSLSAQYAERHKQSQRQMVGNYRDAKEYCRHLFTGNAEEVLYVICMDAQSRVLRAVPAITGTIDEITIYPRTIVGTALQHSAHSVLLAHNHPSGVKDPSDSDIHTTEILRNALNAVDIVLLDHIIYADGECTSMAQWEQLRRIAPVYGKETPKAADAKITRKPKARALNEMEANKKTEMENCNER